VTATIYLECVIVQSNMSSHPYRQQIQSQTPYPLDDEVRRESPPASSQGGGKRGSQTNLHNPALGRTSQTPTPRSNRRLYDPLTPGGQPPHHTQVGQVQYQGVQATQYQGQAGQYQGAQPVQYQGAQAVQYQSPQTGQYQAPQAGQYQVPHTGLSGQLPLDSTLQLQNGQNYSAFQNSHALLVNHGADYPEYEARTPPPVFATKELHVQSPPSNPLSSTSSVTNFNLNPAGSEMYSKSENNLTTPPHLKKNGHLRSVSSTSSFFYDRTDNASMVDFSQNVIQQYLGSNSQTLMPRIKTIELYRKNAKKSNDPTVLFQYAQYMLQTALLVEAEQGKSTFGTPAENSPREASPSNNPSSLNVNKSHKKTKSSNSVDLGNIDPEKLEDKKLKRALLKEAVRYLKRLSDKGYVDAQYLLADAYSSGALEKIENREAFTLFQSAAKHGHIESAYRTSYCYEEGLGTGRDARKAVEYLKMAASKNHPAAMYKLGVYSFYSRMGLPNNINTKKMGIKWLERASNIANELVAAAPYELGKIHFEGFEDIVIPDKKYALELYSQAAALGHVAAAALLGKFYEVGEVVPQDSNLSIHYYTQAALGGDPESMLAMCAWYLVGSEPYLPKDESESFEWAKRSAMCNYSKAQFALGNFYDKGIGCIKNTSEAQAWYTKAAENGEEKSFSRLADKDLALKIQKRFKKANSTNPNSTLSAQEKDCVIM
jgi:TPR repeat protein